MGYSGGTNSRYNSFERPAQFSPGTLSFFACRIMAAIPLQGKKSTDFQFSEKHRKIFIR
jgi:hypothetical protein